ncbi:MAG: FadR/GntR family transcriptional regulator [Acidobacteriaceae bacterium]
MAIHLAIPLTKAGLLMAEKKQANPESQRTMQVVHHIRTLLESGALRQGEKIPSEREFARSLKVSRASLRTGINYLAAMGVLKVRHGVGTFVAEGPAGFDKATLQMMGALHGFQPWQMFEARLILESHLAGLAAERRSRQQHAALSDEVVEMFAAMNSPSEYLVHDIQFHRIISQASGNPILAALMETVSSALYEDRRKTVERSRDLRESTEMHRSIYRAIRAGKAAEARKLMEQHLRLAEFGQDKESPAAPSSVERLTKSRKPSPRSSSAKAS